MLILPICWPLIAAMAVLVKSDVEEAARLLRLSVAVESRHETKRPRKTSRTVHKSLKEHLSVLRLLESRFSPIRSVKSYQTIFRRPCAGESQ